ncbi:hypothetical protein HDU67_006409 [Dinochytrium kinnereticum]|nr:hypothetical protein HDU67_006409 [Dinochytrium kinnereticum]
MPSKELPVVPKNLPVEVLKSILVYLHPHKVCWLAKALSKDLSLASHTLDDVAFARLNIKTLLSASVAGRIERLKKSMGFPTEEHGDFNGHSNSSDSRLRNAAALSGPLCELNWYSLGPAYMAAVMILHGGFSLRTLQLFQRDYSQPRDNWDLEGMPQLQYLDPVKPEWDSRPIIDGLRIALRVSASLNYPFDASLDDFFVYQWAASVNALVILVELLRRFDYTNSVGEHVLLQSCASGSFDVARWALSWVLYEQIRLKALRKAVEVGYHEVVALMINNYEPSTHADELVIKAVLKGHIEVMNLLIEFSSERGKGMALVKAAEYGHLDIVSAALEVLMKGEGESPEAPWLHYVTQAMESASWVKPLPILERLMTFAQSRCSCGVSTGDCWIRLGSALIHAVHSADSDAITFITDSAIGGHRIDDDSWVGAIKSAALSRRFDLLELLLGIHDSGGVRDALKSLTEGDHVYPDVLVFLIKRGYYDDCSNERMADAVARAAQWLMLDELQFLLKTAGDSFDWPSIQPKLSFAVSQAVGSSHNLILREALLLDSSFASQIERPEVQQGLNRLRWLNSDIIAWTKAAIHNQDGACLSLLLSLKSDDEKWIVGAEFVVWPLLSIIVRNRGEELVKVILSQRRDIRQLATEKLCLQENNFLESAATTGLLQKPTFLSTFSVEAQKSARILRILLDLHLEAPRHVKETFIWRTLEAASRNGYVEAVQILLDEVRSIEDPGNALSRILGEAVQSDCNSDVIILLLERVNFDALRACLFHAIEAGQLVNIRVVCAWICGKSWGDESGVLLQKALDEAARVGKWEIALTLHDYSKGIVKD